MGVNIQIRLTPAQVSALECASDDSWTVMRAWRGSTLSVSDAAHARLLADALADLANSEDAQAEECMRLRNGARDVEGARMASGARDALTNLAARVRAAA